MNPYKGLRPYEEQDSDNFFGRDVEKRIVVDKLLAHKLTLLFAASGVGKSSLLRAAVMPELKSPTLENLDVVYCNDWVAEPIATLKALLVAYLRDNQLLAADDDTLDVIDTLPELFRNAVLFTSEPLVVMLDQFEEFFTYQRYGKYFKAFIEQLAAAINDRDTPTTFVIAMREDFALELNAFKPDLPTLLFENFYRLEKLPLVQAKTAIAAPVEKRGFSYEDGLLDTLLYDLSQREQVERFGRDVAAAMEAPPVVEPPHLQIVCMQLWDLDCANPAHLITRATYDQRGGALGLLGGYFQVQIETLGRAEKKLASAAFNYLVNKHGTKMAYPLPDLAKLLLVDEGALGAVLDKLEQARILRRQLRKEVAWYELYHDIFAKSIYDWNEHYKSQQRLKKMVMSAFAVVLGGFGLFAAVNVWLDYSHYHLRLSQQRGYSDVIELYQGRSTGWDVLGQRRWLAETDFQRNDIEPDKLFLARAVGTLPELQVELIGQLPLEERIEAYMEAGAAGKAWDLVEKSLRGGDWQTQQVVIEVVGKIRWQSTLVQLLRYWEGDIQLSYQLKQHLLEVLAQYPSPRFLPLLEMAVKDKSIGVRKNAIVALALQHNVEKAFTLLIESLESDYIDVRCQIAKTLGRLAGQVGTDKAIMPLIKHLADENSSVRHSVAQALGAFAGQTGADKAIVPLIKCLEDEDRFVREGTVQALGAFAKTGADKAIAPLIERLEDEEDRFVRESAAQALGAFAGQTGADKAIAPLIERLEDENSSVRYGATQALSAFAGQMGADRAIAPLIERLEDESSGVRYHAMQALSAFAGQVGADRAIAPLIERLKDENSGIRYGATQALSAFTGQMGADKAIAPLIERLADEDRDVRESATQTLEMFAGQVGTDQAIVPLIECLAEENWEIRYRATQVLGAFVGRIGEDKAIMPLIKRLTDENWEIRDSVTQVLGGFAGQAGADKAIALLIERLTDENSSVRYSAAQTLGAFAGQMDANKVIAPLIERLTDENSGVRYSAAQTLGMFAGQMGADKVIAPLIKHLADENSDVRKSAAQALGAFAGQMGADKAIAPLIKRLADENSDVRKSAAQALGAFAGQMGADKAIAPLIKYLKDENGDVRESVAQALGAFAGQMGANKAIAPLIECLADENSEVRESAAQALGAFAGQTGADKAIAPLIEYWEGGDSGGSFVSLVAFAGQVGNEKVISQLEAEFKANESEVLTTGYGLDVSFYLALFLTHLNSLWFTHFVTEKYAQEKNPHFALLQDLFAKIDFSGHETIINALANLPEALPWLQKLREHKDKNLREAAKQAIQKIQSDTPPNNLTALKNWLNNPKKTWQQRTNAVRALAQMNTKAARQILLTTAKNYPDTPIGNRAYYELAALDEKQLLPILDHHLQHLEQQRQAWRNRRANWNEGFSDAENEAWKEDMNQLAPRPIFTAFVAEKAARLDPAGHGIDLLHHPFAGFREGAQRGFAKTATVAMLTNLIEQREQAKYAPLFRHAAYRAIDLTLQRLETSTNSDDYQQLQTLLTTTNLDTAFTLNELLELDPSKRQQYDATRTALRERIEWTLGEMEYNRE